MFYVALLSALATRPVLFSPGSSLVFCHWVVKYSRAYSHNPYASGDRCHLDFLTQNGIYESYLGINEAGCFMWRILILTQNQL